MDGWLIVVRYDWWAAVRVYVGYMNWFCGLTNWNVINQDVVNQLPVLEGNFGEVLENTILNGNEINAARVELQEQVI